MWKRIRILKAFYPSILMKYYWILFGLVAIAALVQLIGLKSLELTIALFSVNFMVLAIELGKNRISREALISKLESLEMTFNDITSTLISPNLGKKRQEIIEWLNKF